MQTSRTNIEQISLFPFYVFLEVGLSFICALIFERVEDWIFFRLVTQDSHQLGLDPLLRFEITSISLWARSRKFGNHLLQVKYLLFAHNNLRTDQFDTPPQTNNT